MTENINICKRNQEGSLTIIRETVLTVELNETEMILYANYTGKQYEVEGQYNFQYIVIA